MDGFVNQLISGKRVAQTGRSVLIGDPWVGIDEIGVPEEMCKYLTKINPSGVPRPLRDGDIVIVNRQPSLHKGSMMAHTVKTVNHNALVLNPNVLKPYGADFDGDEVTIHNIQTKEAEVEALEELH